MKEEKQTKPSNNAEVKPEVKTKEAPSEKAEKPKEVKTEQTPKATGTDKPSCNFEHLVRICNADLDGNKQILYAMTKIKGVSIMFANAVCNLLKIDKSSKTGEMNKSQISAIDEAIRNPKKLGIPDWMLNRRNDYETGENKHLLSSDLDFQKANDIKKLKIMKCYKGSRHISGLPVRGQRTKSNFRRSKSKGRGSLGVKRKK